MKNKSAKRTLVKGIASILSVLTMLVALTACGANFEITAEAFSNYANENSFAYSDLSDDYKSQSAITGVYAMQNDSIHIELWALDSAENASSWFSSNMETLKSKSSSNVGSYTTKGGDYSFTIDGQTYRLLYSGDKVIYAYGDKDALDTSLKALGIIS